jgi:hypothetical protein
MKVLLALLAASLCVACSASPVTTTASAPKKPVKPGYCAPSCSIAQCDIAFGQACPIECTGGTDGQPLACAPSMSCEATKTAEYHHCLGRCTAIPFECR